jgi:hypothetical protein
VHARVDLRAHGRRLPAFSFVLRALAPAFARACLLAILLGPGSTAAKPVPWLFDVDVPVAERTADAVAGASRGALVEVLQRLTGLDRLPTSPELTEALGRPEAYYDRYVYPEDDVLRIHFTSDAVLDLVNRAGLPLWSADRPVVVGWLALEAGGEREIVYGDHPLAELIEGHARARGVWLKLPLMDLDDQVSVDAATVWARFEPALVAASARYEGELMLLGRIRESGPDTYSADFEVTFDEVPMALRRASDSAERVTAAPIDWIADELARRGSISGSTSNAVRLVVTGIPDVTAYAELLRLLAGLDYVDRYDVLEANGDELVFGVVTRADPDQLLDLLTRDGRLERALVPVPGQRPGARVVWRG